MKRHHSHTCFFNSCVKVAAAWWSWFNLKKKKPRNPNKTDSTSLPTPVKEEIGSLKIVDCPAERFIPIYLIVAGSFGILRCFTSYIRCGKDGDESQSGWTCCLCDLFDFSWFICGNVWVYSIYPPSYDPSNPEYCDYTLYMFTFWVMTAGYIILSLALLCGICYCVFKK